MIHFFKITSILILFNVLCFSQVTIDSTLLNKHSFTKSNSLKNINCSSEINGLKDSISSLKKIVNENNESNNLITSIIIGILTGLVASILTLIGHNYFIEHSLKKRFKYLEGEYEHLVNNEIRQNSRTNIKYHKGAKLFLESKTNYGNWNCLIKMDKDIINIGGGAFNYEWKDEGGFINIILRDENTIYIFPYTLTHNVQKVSFYILRRVIS